MRKSRHIPEDQTQETKPGKRPSEKANQNEMPKRYSQSEFFERRGLVGELLYLDERKEVEPWFFFPEKKNKEIPGIQYFEKEMLN